MTACLALVVGILLQVVQAEYRTVMVSSIIRYASIYHNIDYPVTRYGNQTRTRHKLPRYLSENGKRQMFNMGSAVRGLYDQLFED